MFKYERFDLFDQSRCRRIIVSSIWVARKASQSTNFRSKTLTHIRIFFQAKNGELYLMKTGISLSTDEFGRLNRQVGKINQQIEKMKRKQQQQQQQQEQQHQQQREKSARKRVGGQDDSKIPCCRVTADANKRRKLQLRLEDIDSQIPGDTEVETEETSPPPSTQWQPEEEQLIFWYVYVFDTLYRNKKKWKHKLFV